MTKKTINLYKCLPKEFQNRISLNSCMKVFIGIIILLSVIMGYTKAKNHFSERALEKAITEKNSKKQSIRVLREKFPKIAKSVTLQGDVNEINEILELHKDLKAQIVSDHFSNEKGFSQYYIGLSRHLIESLWLTEIKIQKGGKYIVLKGLTNNVSNVQNLIKQLEKDDVFINNDIKLKKVETSASSAGNDDFSLEIFSKKESKILKHNKDNTKNEKK